MTGYTITKLGVTETTFQPDIVREVHPKETDAGGIIEGKMSVFIHTTMTGRPCIAEVLRMTQDALANFPVNMQYVFIQARGRYWGIGFDVDKGDPSLAQCKGPDSLKKL